MSGIEETIQNMLSSPEEMEKITKLAQSLMDSGSLGNLASMFSGNDDASSDETQKDTEDYSLGNMFDNLNPDMLSSIGKMVSGMNSNSDKYALLTAMSPYLEEKRRTKMSRAIQIAKMAKIAKLVFSENGGIPDV